MVLIAQDQQSKALLKPLFRRLMVLLVLIFVTLAVSFEIFLLNHFRAHVTTDVHSQRNDIAQKMQMLMAKQSSALTIALHVIVTNLDLQKAIVEKDTEALFKQSSALFEMIKHENKITHYTFYDKNRVALLRMHAPTHKGDTVERSVLLKSWQSGKSSWGIDLGKSGELILRSVHPVYDHAQLVGFVEMGKRVEDIFTLLHAGIKGHLSVLVHKEYVDKRAWEEYMGLLGYSNYWDEFSQEAMIYTSTKDYPEIFSTLLQKENYREITFKDKQWFTYIKPFYDTVGNNLGYLWVMDDISEEKERYREFVLNSSLLGAIILTVILGFIYVLLKRTDKKILSQQLSIKEAERRVKELAVQSRTISWETNAEGLYTHISDVCLLVIGYRPLDMEQKMYFHSILDSSASNAIEVFNDKKPLINLENKVIAKDGHYVWVVTNAIPMYDNKGTFLGSRGISMDITHTKEAEMAQQEALARIQKIASRVPGMVYQYRLRADGSSHFPFSSDAIYNIYRVTPEEVVEDASKILDVLHPDDRDRLMASIQASAQTLTLWRQEYRVKFEDGDIRWLFGNAIPEKEADGSVLWHGFIHDITEQKMMEEELKTLNEHLDNKVEQEIAAREKIEKEQEAERTFLVQKSKLSSMGEMMGAIAHQWRQPLNALNINIQNLDDDFDDGLVNKAFINAFIAKNKQTIHFMSKTIDDFRNFFKIDKEKIEFSAKDAITETLSLQSAQFKNRNILVFVEGEDKVLFGFRGEFQQVILNIINNAKDAILNQKTKEGKITITISDDAITIEDNGGGIKKAILERIFEPYFTTKESSGGTGIGLYMSKMIIEKNMGWKLEAVNIKGGIRFSIIYG